MDKNIQELISELFDFAIDNPKNELKRIDLGMISSELAKKLTQHIGIDLTGYVITLDNYGILHTLNQHGIDSVEELRGQIAIGKMDFLQLEQMIETDIVELEGESSIGKPILVFEKTIEKRYFSVWEVRTVHKKRKKNRLFFVTMYARRK